MSTFGRHERGGANRADRSCLAFCPVTYKFVPPYGGTENSSASREWE